jgi:glucokinase
MVGGQALRGGHGLAGEVGHLVVDPSGPRCGCGRRGHVEAYAGGASLARRARATWPTAALVGGRPAPRDADAVFRVARDGDPAARALVEEAAQALGRALAAVGAVVDPARIAVGGAIGIGQPAFVRRATAIARRHCIAETGRSLVVVRAALGEESVLAGAAALGADLADASRPAGDDQ